MDHLKSNLHNWINRLCITSLCLFLTSWTTIGKAGEATTGDGNSSNALLQQIYVTGQITSASSGEPIPGVNVVIKGTTFGVVTDLDGKYSIAIPSQESVLIFSYIGYISQEVVVGEQIVINISLVESLEDLEEVIVVGYGTQKKSDITGAIVRVSEETLREVPAANLNLSLQGRAAGVDIQRTSTRPGAGTQIRIRGQRSLGSPNGPNNDPLIIVDGIPYEGYLNDLNPADITSVEILKDASATAIYGSRGSNGVVLISTRRGEAGKATLTLDSYYGITSIVSKYDVFDGKKFKLMRDISRYDASQPYLPVEQESIDLGRSTDWQDLLYKNGYVTSQNLGISGGNEDITYSLAGGYYKETTVLPEQAFTRYSLRATIDQKIGKRIKIGLNTMNTLGYTDGESASPMYWILAMSPLTIPYDDEGNLIEQPAYPREDAYNPLTVNRTDQWKQQRRRLRTFNTFYGELLIIKGLKYRLNAGFDFNTYKYGFYEGKDTPFRSGSPNQATVDNGEAWSYTLENLLIYQKTFADKHNLTFTGLFSVQERESSNTALSFGNIAADYIQYYNPALSDEFLPNDNSYYSRWGILSYMARANYGYDNRYLVTLTGRADGSSRLAEGNKWHYYPAVALGWNLHNESFMEWSNVWLSNFKLRFGFGQTSNTSIIPYQTLGGLARYPYSFGSTGGVYGYIVNNLPNSNLGWEFTKTINLGLDFGFLSNRISSTLELYRQKTEGILLERSLPPTSGVEGSYLQNIGETENKGLELTLSANILSNVSGFTWDVDLNYFINREKIVALQDTSVKRDIGNGWFVGSPIDVIYDYKKIGIWQTEEEEDALAMGFKPGQIKLKDINDDDRITEEDRIILGAYEPKWIGGLTSRFGYKGIDLSVVLYMRMGGLLVSTLHQPQSYLNTLQGRKSGINVDFWHEEYTDPVTGEVTPANPTNAYPKPDVTYQNPYYGSTLGYFDATYLKVRSINLGWTLPSKWMSKVGIGRLRVYATAQNPFKALFSPYVQAGGLDPEPTGRGGSDTAGLGQRLTVGANTPPTRTIMFGINLKI